MPEGVYLHVQTIPSKVRGCIRLIATLRDLSRSIDDMEAYFLLSPGIERQVAIAGDLRKKLRLLEVDEAVLDEIVTRG